MYKYLVIICSLLVVVGCASSGTPDTNTDLANQAPAVTSNNGDQFDWNNNNPDNNETDDKFDADGAGSDGLDATPVEIITAAGDFGGNVTRSVRFEEKLEAKGGSGSYVWTVSGLPTGLSVVNARLKKITVSGRARVLGSFTVNAQVCDANDLENCAAKTYSILVRDIMVQTRYAPQTFSHLSSFAPADIPETVPPNPCGAPLQIVKKTMPVWADETFGDADVNSTSSMMGNDFEATFQVTGGVPPYTWELRSAAENFWEVGVIPENTSGWRNSTSTTNSAGDTFAIDGTFLYGLRYCPEDPLPAVINEDGVVIIPGRSPTYGTCNGRESVEEVLTVKVTDQCAAAPQTKEKIFNFDLNRGDTAEDVYLHDLRAFEIYIEGKDIDSGSFVVLGLFNGDNQLLADTVAFVPASGKWTIYRLKLNIKRGYENAKLTDINQVKMYINDGSTGYYFDVWTSSIRIYSETFEFYKYWEEPVYWESPYLWWTPARYKTETYLREPPKWQRIVTDHSNYEAVEDCKALYVDYGCSVKRDSWAFANW